MAILESTRSRFLSVAAVGWTVLWAGSSVALAQDPRAKNETAKTSTEAPRPDWRIQCDGSGQALDCRVSQTIIVKQTGQLLISVVVRRPSKTESPALMLHLPHGLYLPAGATIEIEKGKPQRLEVQTCDGRGCYAGSPIGPDMLAAMQKAAELTVTFQDLKKRPITASLPLAGFGEAYRKLP